MKTIITSVLGFNLKADIVDLNDNLLPTGIKSTYFPDNIEPVQPKMVNKRWFTSFNDALLNKIRDARSNAYEY
jgi:hypothetical protein